MAHSPPPQYGHNSYPPYVSSTSPTINHPPPDQYHPTKKPRLSQPQISPQSSPHLTNGSLPNPGFFVPQAAHLNGAPRQGSPTSAQQSPGPVTAGGTMGPPNRPVAEKEKAVDVNELGDVMASSGVDLKDEEAMLLGGHARTVQQGGSFGSMPNTSFTTIYSTSEPGYFDHHSYGHNTLSPNVPGNRGSFYGAGTLNQPTVTPEALEDQALRAEKRAIRRRNEIKQYHLNDPFLQSGVVSEKLKSRTNTIGVHIEQPRSVGPSSDHASDTRMQITVTGQDGYPKLAALRGKSLIAKPGNLTEILTLLSLSCKDRMRDLIEDSSTFAKGRRISSHGIVPLEYIDMATGHGKAEEAVTKLASSASSYKRSFSEMDGNTLPTPDSSASQSVKTIAFPNRDGKALFDLMTKERSLEEKRIERRRNRVPNADAMRASSVAGTPAPGTPGSLDSKPGDPDSVQKKPLTKKELKKQENNKANEAQQHAATNTAASLALGRSGPGWLKGSGGTKSWMTSKSTTNTSFAPMPKRDPAASSKTAAQTATAAKPGRAFGDFREDGVDGSNIQLRDMIAALELDVKEKRALSKAYGKVNTLKD